MSLFLEYSSLTHTQLGDSKLDIYQVQLCLQCEVLLLKA